MAWTLWYDHIYFHDSYAESLDPDIWITKIKPVTKMSNHKDIWNTLNWVYEPSEMLYKDAYYIFAENILPRIDEKNKSSVHFIIDTETNIDLAWEITVLSLLNTTKINGVSIINHKAFYEITIWGDSTKKYIDIYTELYSKYDITVENIYVRNAPYFISSVSH